MIDTLNLSQKIRIINDFPVPGISFKDITPILEDKIAFQKSIDYLVEVFENKKIDKVAGIEARGFLFASVVAYRLNAGLIMIRKKGKLPAEKVCICHNLEYGESSLEMHKDSVCKNERILIIDDVLATGGTAEAAVKLIEMQKGQVIGLGFLLEVPLGGRTKLAKYNLESVIIYD